MKLRAPSVILALSFAACGRLDLGGYAANPPAGDDHTVGGQPVLSNSGAGGTRAGDAGRVISAGQPSVGGGAGDTAAAGGTISSAGAAGHDAELGAGAGGDDSELGGGAAGAGAAGAAGEGGAAGADEPSPTMNSCRGMPNICGNPQSSCCSVGLVTGGEFVVGGLHVSETKVQSHVSSFYLGRFEVTVSRFRAFLAAYDSWRAGGGLQAGAGRHPLIPGSGWDPAWLRRANDPPEQDGLGVDHTEIEAQVTSCLKTPFSTVMWSQPVNCVTFYEAQAFCIWDGGRLPTNLEWEYAAAGGDENRTYPWGSEEPIESLAMYGCNPNLPTKVCNIPSVGTYPAGAGRFGQLDLGGSVAEWTFDTLGKPRPIPCDDCASVEQLYPDNPRITRGGDWTSGPDYLRVAYSIQMPSGLHLSNFGFRCAYDSVAPKELQ